MARGKLDGFETACLMALKVIAWDRHLGLGRIEAVVMDNTEGWKFGAGVCCGANTRQMGKRHAPAAGAAKLRDRGAVGRAVQVPMAKCPLKAG